MYQYIANARTNSISRNSLLHWQIFTFNKLTNSQIIQHVNSTILLL